MLLPSVTKLGPDRGPFRPDNLRQECSVEPLFDGQRILDFFGVTRDDADASKPSRVRRRRATVGKRPVQCAAVVFPGPRVEAALDSTVPGIVLKIPDFGFMLPRQPS